MKNLENYGVQELNAREIQETEGGIWGILGGLLLGFALEVASNPEAHWDAFKEGMRSAH